MSDHRPPIAWTDRPDGDGGVYYAIRSPRIDKDVLGHILSETVIGVMTYWIPPLNPGEKGQSMPCTCGAKPCPGKVHDRSHRWKGYVACFDSGRGRLFLAEISKEAYARCQGFEYHKGALRGKMLRLTRAGAANNGRVTAYIHTYGGPLLDLPPAFNVQSALERIWYGPKAPYRPTRGEQPGRDDSQDDGEGSGVPVG